MKAIERLISEMKQYIWLPVSYEYSIYATLATCVNLWQDKGDPVWLQLYGEPSSGKSLILQSLASNQISSMTYITDQSTSKAMLSGFKGANGKDMSGVQQMNNKVVVIKDFTTQSSSPKDDAFALLGQLRTMFDGEISYKTGITANTKYECRFPLIIGVTPDLVNIMIKNNMTGLGERFLRCDTMPRNMNRSHKKIMLEKQHDNIDMGIDITKMMKDLVGSFLSKIRAKSSSLKFPVIRNDMILSGTIPNMAEYVSSLRSNGGEMPARVNGQLNRLARCLGVIFECPVQIDGNVINIVRKICKDSVGIFLSEMIDCIFLLDKNQPLFKFSVEDIMKITNNNLRPREKCPALSMVRQYINLLEMINWIEVSNKEGEIKYYRATDELREIVGSVNEVFV